jgi:hypothetical protein
LGIPSNPLQPVSIYPQIIREVEDDSDDDDGPPAPPQPVQALLIPPPNFEEEVVFNDDVHVHGEQ